MLTFAQLKQNPALLTSAVRSPIVHATGGVTVLWQGDAAGADLVCRVEWLDGPQALERIPGTDIWGADLPAPPLPAAVCSTITIGSQAQSAPLHVEAFTGPLTPPLPIYAGAPSPLVAEVSLPSLALTTPTRRARIFAPADGPAPTLALLALDGQTFAGPDADLPIALDDLRRSGAAPQCLVVAIDGAPGAGRHAEFLMDGPQNAATRRWFAEVAHPTLSAQFGVERWLVAGWSNSASLALQLTLERPDLFAGCAAFSPWSRGGAASVQALAERWSGDSRIWLSHGTFGLGEARMLPTTRALAQALTQRGAQTRYHEAEGYGHCYGAWGRLLPLALRWLFAT